MALKLHIKVFEIENKKQIIRKGVETMKAQEISNVEYIPPEIKVIDANEIFANFSPALSCSAFGGSVSAC